MSSLATAGVVAQNQAVAQAVAGTPPPAACIRVRTPGDLNNVRNDLAGHYCLANDIDMSAVENFAPIGTSGNAFTGTLDGRGHTIRNLSIASSDKDIGLFGVVSAVDALAKISNLTLQNIRVSGLAAPSTIGALVGEMDSGIVIGIHVSGSVSCSQCSEVGGLIGFNGTAKILQSSASVSVNAAAVADLGGLVGANGGSISQSYATGMVSAGSPNGGGSHIGGLVGTNPGTIVQSFATGPVIDTSSGDGVASDTIGGLVGEASSGTIDQSFAIGSVTPPPVVGHVVGGLAGDSGGAIHASYAIGRVVRPAQGPYWGGLVGLGSSATKAYWDTQTSSVSTSAAGIGRTTRQLQAHLPRGFAATTWAVTPSVSFPYLTGAGLNFAAPLAIKVKGNRIYTFLPISQLDMGQYASAAAHADEASLAAAFTIIARAVGITDGVAKLRDVAIDTYFWSDATQKARWRGPVTAHASLGAMTAVAGALGEGNVIGALRADQVVLIRGKYRKDGGGSALQWMLATSFVTDGDDNVIAVVADDPWTGLQVRIDPGTKEVVAPANFPLRNFRVNAFQIVTLD